uniref:Exocyst complex component Sec8 n=1 Tax=Panagrellus redivivus TaxID=6233 RepID=A0A7E4UNG4_PANRE
MERRIFLPAIPGCTGFVAEYNSVRQGLLHIVVGHYRQLQKAIPALGVILRSLPCDLYAAIKEAAFANLLNMSDRLKDVETLLIADKSSASITLLNEAQNLVADYLNAEMTSLNWQTKTFTKARKLRQIFEHSSRKTKLLRMDQSYPVKAANETNWSLMKVILIL